jgi:pimeloyl-ACP methyl ester carboxylesterase
VVAGTSFGGLVALRWAQQEPRQVAALALIDSVGLGRALPWVLRLVSLRALSTFAVRPSRRAIRWQLHRLLMAHAARLGETHLATLSEYLWQSAAATNWTRLALAFSLFSTLRGQREVLTDDELRGLSMRTLILWGEHDRFLPQEHGRRAAALVPDAQLRIIPAAGHSPNWEAPADVLERFSRFLRDEPQT